MQRGSGNHSSLAGAVVLHPCHQLSLLAYRTPPQEPKLSRFAGGGGGGMLAHAKKRVDYLPVSHAAADAYARSQGPSGDTASLLPVLICVGIASLGAFAFGYHLGVVNGPLQAISAELGLEAMPR